ncbi:fibroblast growth factor receptor-like [Hydra vulgaris]|uniref:Fibroblast growth factor receptor-like n=1 Tax=Hydra vulgaris TaxID=6087 RepID=A0ABM4C7R5_HYDVU
MEYLSCIKLVHRDLAARNILVGANKNAKISDFGLTRKINSELNYMGCNRRLLPIKWMSVEAIFEHMFTSHSDVWSYGVVLFEIVTLGEIPYPSISNRELIDLLKNGYRMDRPDNCSQFMFDYMLRCWNEDPLQRPTFTELRELFESKLSRSSRYFSFELEEGSTNHA